MFEISGIDHIVLRTNKASKMLKFYCEIMGAIIEKQQPKIGLTQLRVGINLIDIMSVDNVNALTQTNMDHFCLLIKPFDYHALKNYFLSKGVEIYNYGKRYGAQGLGFSFYLRDPEGNEIELKEYIEAGDE